MGLCLLDVMSVNVRLSVRRTLRFDVFVPRSLLCAVYHEHAGCLSQSLERLDLNFYVFVKSKKRNGSERVKFLLLLLFGIGFGQI